MKLMPESIFTFQEYQLKPEDLCSLCGINVGKASMIGCKDKIHICLNCVDLLSDIKKERLENKRDETVNALLATYFNAPPHGEPNDADRKGMIEVYNAIVAGKIPHVKID